MLLGIPVLLGLIAGKLSGGSFKNLSLAPLRWAWLFLVGLGIQLVLYTGLTDQQSWNIKYGHGLYVISLGLLFAALLVNMGRLQWPLVILTAGAGLNLLVIGANGGAMPASRHLLTVAEGKQVVTQIAHHRKASNVTIASPQSRLVGLDDHIQLPVGGAPFSLGDILIGIGGMGVIVAEMHEKRSEEFVKARSTSATAVA